MVAPKKVDYDRIEAGWRAGLLSPQQLAELYTAETGVKVSRTSIIKYFEGLGVPRDLAAKIRAKSDDMLLKSKVAADKVADKVATKDIIRDAASEITDIRLHQRGDILRFRKLSIKLLDELEHQTENQDLYQQMGELLRAETDSGIDKLNDLYNRVISTPSRIDSNKKLAETLRHLIALEREAYNIDSNTREEKPTIATESISSEDAARIYMDMIHGSK